MIQAAAVLDEYPKTVVLKDGAHLVLRPRVHAGTVVAGPLETAIAAAERARDAAGGAVTILAVDGERAVAAAVVTPSGGAGVSSARVTVVLDPAYRGRRLGTWLLLDAMHLAAGLGARELVAESAAGDEPYLAALGRLDFVADGAPAPDGSIVLRKRLHSAWTDF